jgi:hypothetical protein
MVEYIKSWVLGVVCGLLIAGMFVLILGIPYVNQIKAEKYFIESNYLQVIKSYQEPSLQDTYVKVNGTLNIQVTWLSGNYFEGNGTLNIITDGGLSHNIFGKGITVNVIFVKDTLTPRDKTYLQFNASYSKINAIVLPNTIVSDNQIWG